MKKILLSAGVIIIFTGYAIYQNSHSAPAVTSSFNNTPTQSGQTLVTQTATTSTGSGSNPPATTPVITSPAPTPTPAPAPVVQQTTGQFKDGTYTGSVADAFYGSVQVAAVISGGKLTNVQFLQYPSDRGHSMELSQAALPQLKTEAIAAQTSVVDVYSGATQTSQAFMQSLQSALSQAKS